MPLIGACMQSAVYLARSGKMRLGGALHCPARRIARTCISLGPVDGIMFGLRAIRCVHLPAQVASGFAGSKKSQAVYTRHEEITINA